MHKEIVQENEYICAVADLILTRRFENMVTIRHAGRLVDILKTQTVGHRQTGRQTV